MSRLSDLLRHTAQTSSIGASLERAADQIDACERVRAIVDKALAERQAQPYDAMGEAPGIPLSQLVEALKGAGE